MTSNSSHDEHKTHREEADAVAQHADDQPTETPAYENNEMDASHRPEPDAEQPTWTSGQKFGVGTAADHEDDASRVWFTLSAGGLTEPRFPRVDLLQYRVIDFLVADPDTGYTARTHRHDRTSDSSIDRTTQLVTDEALVYRHEITETATDHGWELSVEYVTDPATESVLLDVNFESTVDRQYDVYLVAEAAVSGYVRGTAAQVIDSDEGYALGAWETGTHEPAIRDESGDPYDVTTAIGASDAFEWAGVATSPTDTMHTLLELGRPPDSPAGGSARHTDGESTPSSPTHVDGDERGERLLVGRVASDASECSEELAIGFAEDASLERAHDRATAALERGYATVRERYHATWESYLADRPLPDSVAGDEQLTRQYRAAVMVLKAVEDKTFRGAGVASPSVPWGDNVAATVPRDYGYNFTWSRDLYQVFTALRIAGDLDSARRTLEYLYDYQQREDGFLPQNTYLDGRTRWGGEQLDNVAFPAVMAYQLAAQHDIHPGDADYSFEDVSRSLSYLLDSGPRTEQERWEEEDGYSPSTIAAIVAGLGCGAALADLNGARDQALVSLAHADAWRLAVDDWCVTETGTARHEQTPYYVRISADGDPDSPSTRELANNGPELDERNIIDAGFLELVRLGLREPDEEVIRNSLEVVDETIRVETPNGPCWYRYNGDSYGELGPTEPDEGAPWSPHRAGKGRLWPIFTGERGEYELLAETTDGQHTPENLLRSMARFANEGLMIPEQVWDREDETAYGWEFGTGTGAATPLAWSMAQFVRLAHGIDAGEPVETPLFLAARYRDGEPEQPSLDVTFEHGDETVTITGETNADVIRCWTQGGIRRLSPTDGTFETSVPVEDGAVAIVAATDAPDLVDVGTALERETWD